MAEFNYSLSYWIKLEGGDWKFQVEYFPTYESMLERFNRILDPQELHLVETVTVIKTKEKANEKNDSRDFTAGPLYGNSSASRRVVPKSGE